MTTAERLVSVAVALAAALVVTVAAGCREELPAPPPAFRPNVLVIVMDTTRADHCSTDGYARPTTPNLERLAARGVNFRDAWAPAGWTTPSHASLFTGLRPIHHDVIDGVGLYLRPEFTTLAEHLQRAGWATGCFVNNTVISKEFGLTQGFETYAPIYDFEGIPHPSARATHEAAMDYMRTTTASGRPFFVFVNDLEPHQPYNSPPETLKLVGVDEPTGPAAVAARAFQNPLTLLCNVGAARLDPEVAALLPGLYDAEIAFLDDEIGRLLADLEKAELLDSTLVVVTADHGENLGDHGLWGHRFSLHRSVCRVPLVLRLPGKFDGGREVRDPVRLEDVLPTVLEVCGLPVPSGLDGQTLLRDLPGRICRATWGPQDWNRPGLLEALPDADSPLFDRRIRSVFDGRYHLLQIDDEDMVELYDVQADPGETRDLASAFPEVVRRLRDLLDP